MYKYEDFKNNVSVAEAQPILLALERSAQKLHKTAGAFSGGALFHSAYMPMDSRPTDSWLQLAYLDRLVELGVIRKIGNRFSGDAGIYVLCEGWEA